MTFANSSFPRGQFNGDLCVSDVSFVVVDCETTGFSPVTNRLIQVAAVVISGAGQVLESFDTIVRPENPNEYTHAAQHVHGISAEQVSDGMSLHQALTQLWHIADGHFFTAHNARFDLGFLHAESDRVGIGHRVSRFVDTLELARHVDVERTRKHSLQALCDHYGIAQVVRHDALADATATAELLVHLLADLGITRADQLEDLLTT